MTKHRAVLAKEVVEGLYLTSGETVIDATLGGGGHTVLLKKAVGETGTVLSLDMDIEAIARFEAWLQSDALLSRERTQGRLILVHANFSDIGRVANEEGCVPANAVFADLGYSSDQMEDGSRGLSFMQDGPLDMRLDRQKEETAEHIINTWSEAALSQLFSESGDEECAHSIARAIVKQRVVRTFSGTHELAHTIEHAMPDRIRAKRKTHPATKVFQALRIAVNNEYDNLVALLEQSVAVLERGGRIGIISFHSGEDRIVKWFFKKMAKGCECPPEFPVCVCHKQPLLRIITENPVIPSEQEMTENPRSRSAKLRFAEKL